MTQVFSNKQKGIKKPTVSNKLKGQKITWDLGTSTAVLQFDKQDNLIAEYTSYNNAVKITGLRLAEVLRGAVKTAGGFIWKKKEYLNKIVRFTEFVLGCF